jgi:hypothetical protein
MAKDYLTEAEVSELLGMGKTRACTPEEYDLIRARMLEEPQKSAEEVLAELGLSDVGLA